MVIKIIETLLFIGLCLLVAWVIVAENNSIALFISKILVSLFFGLLFFGVIDFIWVRP